MRVFTFLFFLLFSVVGYSQITLPIDFESTTITYTFGDFEGGVLSVIDNPDQSGINTSDKVAQMVKNTGQPFAGSSITLDGPMDFTNNNTVRMKVWSPRVGARVLFKVENSGDPGIFFEKEEATTVANTWESIEFDYSGINTANSYDKIVLIFDNGTVGDGSANFTFYLDDIELDFVTPPARPDLPITFENDTLDYDLTDFGGNASSIVVDPTDTSNMVGQAIRTGAALTFAGTTMGNNGLANPIPFTPSETKMKVRVWSPEAGVPIRLKVEDAADPTRSVETEATTTVAQSWETLEFDFSNEAMGTAAINFTYTYNKISIFFNFGAEGTVVGEQTYYWDDVAFGPRISVVDIVVGSMDHDTLEAAVIAAGLAPTLSGAGPFTVFAPTDDAFAALPAGTLATLLADPMGDLSTILQYHVLGAEVLSGDLSDGQTAETLQGEDITVSINGMNVMINQANVTMPDITTDNGVVHVIDAVLLPPSLTNVETLKAEDFGIVVTPNPATDFLQVRLPASFTEEVTVDLYDRSGQLVRQRILQGSSTQVPVNDLTAGLYFMTLRTGDAVYYTKVMVGK